MHLFFEADDAGLVAWSRDRFGGRAGSLATVVIALLNQSDQSHSSAPLRRAATTTGRAPLRRGRRCPAAGGASFKLGALLGYLRANVRLKDRHAASSQAPTSDRRRSILSPLVGSGQQAASLP